MCLLLTTLRSLSLPRPRPMGSERITDAYLASSYTFAQIHRRWALDTLGTLYAIALGVKP